MHRRIFAFALILSVSISVAATTQSKRSSRASAHLPPSAIAAMQKIDPQRMRDLGITFIALGDVVQLYRQHPASLMHTNTPRKESDFRLAVLKSIRRRRRLGLGPATALVLTDSVERA